MSDMMSVHVFVMKNKLDNVELMVNDRHTKALCLLRTSTRFLHGSHVMLTGRHPLTTVRFLHKREGADWGAILRGALAGTRYPRTICDSWRRVSSTLGIPFVVDRTSAVPEEVWFGPKQVRFDVWG
jgi:hypothetical protein